MRFDGVVVIAIATALASGCSDEENPRGHGSDGGSGGEAGSGAGGAGGQGGGAVPLQGFDLQGNPVAGVDVAVHDATGALTAELVTDASGAAPADFPDGGGVSIFWRKAESNIDPGLRIDSYLGL